MDLKIQPLLSVFPGTSGTPRNYHAVVTQVTTVMLEIGLADWLAGLLILAVGILAPIGILAARHGLLGRAREEASKFS